MCIVFGRALKLISNSFLQVKATLSALKVDKLWTVVSQLHLILHLVPMQKVDYILTMLALVCSLMVEVSVSFLKNLFENITSDIFLVCPKNVSKPYCLYHSIIECSLLINNCSQLTRNCMKTHANMPFDSDKGHRQQQKFPSHRLTCM